MTRSFRYLGIGVIVGVGMLTTVSCVTQKDVKDAYDRGKAEGLASAAADCERCRAEGRLDCIRDAKIAQVPIDTYTTQANGNLLHMGAAHGTYDLGTVELAKAAAAMAVDDTTLANAWDFHGSEWPGLHALRQRVQLSGTVQLGGSPPLPFNEDIADISAVGSCDQAAAGGASMTVTVEGKVSTTSLIFANSADCAQVQPLLARFNGKNVGTSNAQLNMRAPTADKKVEVVLLLPTPNDVHGCGTTYGTDCTPTCVVKACPVKDAG